MSRLSCRLGWHSWRRYSEVVYCSPYMYQFRTCKDCNKIDQYKLPDYLRVNTSGINSSVENSTQVDNRLPNKIKI